MGPVDVKFLVLAVLGSWFCTCVFLHLGRELVRSNISVREVWSCIYFNGFGSSWSYRRCWWQQDGGLSLGTSKFSLIYQSPLSGAVAWVAFGQYVIRDGFTRVKCLSAPGTAELALVALGKEAPRAWRGAEIIPWMFFAHLGKSGLNTGQEKGKKKITNSFPFSDIKCKPASFASSQQPHRQGGVVSK